MPLQNDGLSIFGNTRTEDALLTRGGMIGKSFYVHTAGADTNGGLTPDDPLLTVEAAVGKCTNDKGDYIFVLDCYNDDTFAITVDKSTCHIIGLSLPAPWQWAILNGGGTDVFQIDANYVEIAGIGMISASADAISIGNVGYGWIHHCSFAYAAAGLNNAVVASTGTPTSTLFEDNMVGGNAGTCIALNGLTGNLTDWVIRNNVFRYIRGKAINIGGSMNVGAIIGNFFFSPIVDAEAKGWAITLGLSTQRGIIANNMASATGDDQGNNPFLDLSTGNIITTTNGWVHNYVGETISPPAVTA